MPLFTLASMPSFTTPSIDTWGHSGIKRPDKSVASNDHSFGTRLPPNVPALLFLDSDPLVVAKETPNHENPCRTAHPGPRRPRRAPCAQRATDRGGSEQRHDAHGSGPQEDSDHD